MARARLGPVLGVLALLGFPSVLAEGGETIGITPPELGVPVALHGEVYVRSFVVQNRFNGSTTVTLEPSGLAGDWVTTNPKSGFVVPPQTNAVVEVRIAVPTNATNGTYSGLIRAIAEPKTNVTGTGFQLRYAAAVRLNVSVGGNATPQVRIAQTRAEDIEVGTAPVIATKIANEGNVRSEVKVLAEIFDKSGRSLGRRELSLGLSPGESLDVPLDFARDLPEGVYEVRIVTTADGATPEVDIREFRVVAPGGLAKTGRIKFFQHSAWVDAGLPVRVNVLFENTGTATIARAQFFGEAIRNGIPVAAFTSPALIVGPRSVSNLSFLFTPTEGGTVTLRGKVVFDGVESSEVESILNVRPGAPPSVLPQAVAEAFEYVATPEGAAVTGAGGGGLFFLLFFWRRRRARSVVGPDGPLPFGRRRRE